MKEKRNNSDTTDVKRERIQPVEINFWKKSLMSKWSEVIEKWSTRVAVEEIKMIIKAFPR